MSAYPPHPPSPYQPGFSDNRPSAITPLAVVGIICGILGSCLSLYSLYQNVFVYRSAYGYQGSHAFSGWHLRYTFLSVLGLATWVGILIGASRSIGSPPAGRMAILVCAWIKLGTWVLSNVLLLVRFNGNVSYIIRPYMYAGNWMSTLHVMMLLGFGLFAVIVLLQPAVREAYEGGAFPYQSNYGSPYGGPSPAGQPPYPGQYPPSPPPYSGQYPPGPPPR